MAHEVLATVPGLASGGAAKFDPRLYLLFWALELPDIPAATTDPYVAFQAELTQLLGQAKAKLSSTAQEKRRSDAQLAHAPAAPVGGRGGMANTANERPIVTKDDVEAAEAVVASVEARCCLLPCKRHHDVLAMKQLAAHCTSPAQLNAVALALNSPEPERQRPVTTSCTCAGEAAARAGRGEGVCGAAQGVGRLLHRARRRLPPREGQQDVHRLCAGAIPMLLCFWRDCACAMDCVGR
jgi:hypothetical protein